MEHSAIDRKTAGLLLGVGTATGLFLFALFYLVANSLTFVSVTVPSAVPIEVVVALLGLALLSIACFVAVLLGFGQEGGDSGEANEGLKDKTDSGTETEETSIEPDDPTGGSEGSSASLAKRADIGNDSKTSARSSGMERKDAMGGSGPQTSKKSTQRGSTRGMSGDRESDASIHGTASDSPKREGTSAESEGSRDLPPSYVRQTAEINADQRSQER